MTFGKPPDLDLSKYLTGFAVKMRFPRAGVFNWQEIWKETHFRIDGASRGVENRWKGRRIRDSWPICSVLRLKKVEIRPFLAILEQF